MFAIPGLLAIECGMPQHIGTSGAATKVTVTIDAGLKKKCPRTALACVTARVEAGASSAALLEEMKNAGKNEIQKTAFSAGRAGVSASGSHARGLQNAGKRSVAVPRLGGSAVAAHGGGKRACRKSMPLWT